MASRLRPFRTSAAVFAAASALVVMSGCSSGSPGSDATGDKTQGPGSSENAVGNPSAKPLKPLPAKVPSALKPYYEQKLRWRNCGPEGFQCATLKAPLDYERPQQGKDLKLAVTRKQSDGGSGQRIGSLLANPGGPGGSAVEYVQQAAGVGYPQKVRQRYDIVGMDPRGVGLSTPPVKCLSDKAMDSFTQTDQTPDDKGEKGKLVSAYKDFAKGCEERSEGLLAHVSTEEAARDMDILRAVLGDKKLNYTGASYGTFLGATYAGLFPQRSGRLVLDGALDPTLTAQRVNREQTGGFETAFKSFAKDCIGQKSCPLGSESVPDASKRMSAFFRQLDAKPVATGESRKLTESLATTGVIRAMYDEGSWPRLRGALAKAQKGDGKHLLALADEYYERDPDGSYGNIMYANPAVNCLDLPPAFSGTGEVEKALPSFEKASPVFGRGFAWAALNCAYWKHKPVGETRQINAEGAGPILVIGTTRDPATPYAWSRGLAGQLSSARLLTYDGDGHTAYLRGGPCVNDAVDTYLLTGKPPEDGTTCKPGA